ncbi:ABC transporter permease subunit, partial [Brucella grignonensis]
KLSYVAALLNVVVAMVFVLFVVRGVLGKALIAIRDSEKLAAARGINRVCIHALLFTVTSALTGLTGGLYVAYNGTVGPAMFDFSTLTLLLTMMIVGGMGTLYGPVMGAALIYG